MIGRSAEIQPGIDPSQVGPSQPPRKRVVATAAIEIMAVYSARIEHPEAEPGVLGVEPAHQFLLGLDQVEWRPVGLGHGGDAEDDEGDDLWEEVPAGHELKDRRESWGRPRPMFPAAARRSPPATACPPRERRWRRT